MHVIGADPGITGALAVLDGEGNLVEVFDMPVFKIKGKSKIDVHAVGKFFSRYASDGRAVVELVGAMPGQGVSSMFTFGFAAGVLHGAIGGLSIPLETVSPRTWKAHFRLGKDKDESRQRATRRWPSGPFSRVKDGGRAEAALIALYSIETARTGSVPEPMEF